MDPDSARFAWRWHLALVAAATGLVAAVYLPAVLFFHQAAFFPLVGTGLLIGWFVPATWLLARRLRAGPGPDAPHALVWRANRPFVGVALLLWALLAVT